MMPADPEAKVAARAPQDYSASEYDGAIAIIGMSLRLPQARTPEQFWEIIDGGRCVLTRFTPDELRAAGIAEEAFSHPDYVPMGGRLDGIEDFDAAFFGFTPREARLLSPQNRLLFECCWEAFERAGIDPLRQGGHRTGVFLGQSVDAYWPRIVSRGSQEDSGELHFFSNPDYLATSIAHRFDLRGPALTVQSFCSTSLLAVHIARQSLLEMECDTALAGAAAINIPQAQGYRADPDSIYTPDGVVRTFDAAANGTMFGNGVGVVLLKRLEDALAGGDPIEAIIRGSAANNDGSRKAGYNAPSVEGQARAVARALRDARVPPQSIGYVECHGTGTLLGDPVEVAALTRAFAAQTPEKGFCAVGSAKPHVGHVDRAAGVIGLIKATLALRNRRIPALLNFKHPNPRIDFTGSAFYPPVQSHDWPAAATPRRAGVNALGYGGTNVHIVLEEAPPVEEPAERQVLLVLSARDAASLDSTRHAMAEWIEAHPEASLGNIAHSLQLGRHAFGFRIAVIARDAAEAVAGLRAAELRRIPARPPAPEWLPGGLPDEALAQLSDELPAAADCIAQAGMTGIAPAQALAAMLARAGLAPQAAIGAASLRCRIGARQPGDDCAVQETGTSGASLLGVLAELWLQGITPDFSVLAEGSDCRRIALPTTAYNRSRCWVDAPSPASDLPAETVAPVQTDPVQPLSPFGQVTWQPLHAPRSTAPALSRLVVMTRPPACEPLCAELEARGETVLRLVPGDDVVNLSDGIYALDDSSQAQIETLLTRLRLWGPDSLVFCADREGESPEGTFFRALRWIQGVDAVWPGKPMRIDVLAPGMVQVTGADRLLPQNAVLPPLLATAAAEYPALRVAAVDTPNFSGPKLAVDLAADLPPVVARRGRNLWRRAIVPLDAPSNAVSLGARLREGGVYVLTGGLGGIARTFAAALLKGHGARIALIIRAMPAPDSERARKLAELRSLPGEVFTILADMANPAEIASALMQVRARFGRIDGVLHAAGVAGRSALHDTRAETSQTVFAPKITGTQALLSALASDHPDFVVLCSSLAAIKPAYGQGDYAAANAVMDALAEVAEPAFPVVSIGWNSWRGIGAMHDRLEAPVGVTPITGHAWLDRLLRMPDGSFICEGSITEGDHWLSGDHRLDGVATLSGTTLSELVMQGLALAGNVPFLPCRIQKIVFATPLQFAPGETRELRLRFAPATAGVRRFSIESLVGETSRVHALGHAQTGIPSQPAGRAPGSVRAITARARARQGSALGLSGRWACDVTQGRGCARVMLDPAFMADLDQHPLHPALFDIASSTLAQRDDLPFMLPLAHEGLSLYRPLPAEVFVEGTQLSAAPGCLALSLVLHDNSGETVATLERICFATPDTAADQLEQLLADLPPEAATANPFEADSVSPEEGLAALLALPLDAGPHVIVSKQRMHGLTACPPATTATAGKATVRERPEPREFLRGVWQAMLGTPAPSDDAHFFELGGNSLAATRVLARVKDAFGRAPSLRAFFHSPTITDLVRFIDGEEAATATPLTPVEAGGADDEWETGSL